jgi:hypothetical protein
MNLKTTPDCMERILTVWDQFYQFCIELVKQIDRYEEDANDSTKPPSPPDELVARLV